MIKKILPGLLLIATVAVAIAFLCKDVLLKHKVNNLAKLFHARTGGYLIVNHAAFTSFPEFKLQNISLQDSLHKPVVEIKSISARIALKQILQLKAGLAGISIDTLNATFIKDSTGSNYSFITQNKLKNKENDGPRIERKLSNLVNNLFKHIADVAKFKGELHELKFKFVVNGNVTHIHIPYGLLNKGVFNMSVNDQSFASVLGWNLKGEIGDNNKRIDFVIERTGNARSSYFPFFNKSGKPNMGCSRIFASIQNIQSSPQLCTFNYIASVDSFKINHWRIANEAVVLDSLRCNLKCPTELLEAASSS